MPDSSDYEQAGKRILLGLHRAGQTFAHGGGKIIDLMTFGQLNAAEGIDEFTDQVGLAYADLGALPDDSPEAKYVKTEKAVRLAEQRQTEAKDAADRAASDAVFRQLQNPLAFSSAMPAAAPEPTASRRPGPPPRPLGPDSAPSFRPQPKSETTDGINVAGLFSQIAKLTGGLS